MLDLELPPQLLCPGSSEPPSRSSASIRSSRAAALSSGSGRLVASGFRLVSKLVKFPFPKSRIRAGRSESAVIRLDVEAVRTGRRSKIAVIRLHVEETLRTARRLFSVAAACLAFPVGAYFSGASGCVDAFPVHGLSGCLVSALE